jgi:hemerythrin superfamily protein
MNALDLLIQDHRVVEKLFSEFQTATAGRRAEAFGEVYTELTMHTEIEEQIFYPALMTESAQEVEHSLDEHTKAKALLQELQDTDTDNDSFDTRFTELMADVQKHIREEEQPGGLMDIARQRLGEAALDEMGMQMEMMKGRMQGPKAA